MRIVLVGLDPEQAKGLAGLLRRAEQALDASSARVQRLLDEAGVGSTVPTAIRGVARTCGGEASDLERRAGLVRAPGPVARIWRWSPVSSGGSSCGPTPLPFPQSAYGGRTAATPMSIVTLGPTILVTPRAPRSPGAVVYTTVGGQACGPSYVTAGPAGVGQPVPPPPTLPAFPNAKGVKWKTPVQRGGGARKRWKDPDGTIYEWDRQHGTVEVYSRNGRRHLGEYDPDTGEQVKPPDPTRKVEP